MYSKKSYLTKEKYLFCLFYWETRLKRTRKEREVKKKRMFQDKREEYSEINN